MQNESLIEKGQRPLRDKWDLDTKTEVAKLGMAAPMVVVVGTTFNLKNRTMKNLHTGAGVALLGFSLWHHMLYQPAKKKAPVEAVSVKVIEEKTELA